MGAHQAGQRNSCPYRYLTETWGIPAPAKGWPWPVAFDPDDAALVLSITADNGYMTAVQRVFLTPDGQKNPRGPNGTAKQTRGVPGTGAIRLTGPAQGPLLICEGPETGLSAGPPPGTKRGSRLDRLGGSTRRPDGTS
jgi:hypothetical protein